MRILIADDAQFMRTVIKRMVETLGHTVVGEASNGTDAIRLYKEHKPDIVTMDITMEDMSGVEALKQIKMIDPNAKIIMCSAMGHQKYVLDALREGAIDFVVKPFKIERIKDVLNKHKTGGYVCQSSHSNIYKITR